MLNLKEKSYRLSRSLDGRSLYAGASLLWRRGIGSRRRVVLPRPASAQVPTFHELSVVHHPERAEVILVSHETFVQRQVRPDSVLQVNPISSWHYRQWPPEGGQSDLKKWLRLKIKYNAPIEHSVSDGDASDRRGETIVMQDVKRPREEMTGARLIGKRETVTTVALKPTVTQTNPKYE